MSPDEFQQRYAAALAEEPPRPPAEQDVAVAQGRLLLHRRRIAAGASACLAVVAIAGITAVGLGNDGGRNVDDHETPAVSPSPDPERAAEERLLDRCRNGELQDLANAKAFFRSGTPVVKVLGSTKYDASAALESADGRFWAWCRVTPGHPEWSGMDVYRSTGDRGRDFFSYGGDGCSPAMLGSPDVPDCPTFRMRWAERVSPEIATIVFVMGNGESVRLEGNDGYFVNEYVGDLPTGVKQGSDGDLPDSFETFRSVTYLDADGVPIAAQGPNGRVGDLPTLARYPFLGTQP